MTPFLLNFEGFAGYPAKLITFGFQTSRKMFRVSRGQRRRLGFSTSGVRKLPLSRRERVLCSRRRGRIILLHRIHFLEPIHQKLNFKATCWSRGR